MDSIDRTAKYCIIGAGAAGITAAKNLKALDIPFDVLEREDDVGGNWYYGRPNSAVYKSTRLLSSKPMTAYTDFPMPADYPTLFVVGLLQPDSGIFWLMDYQAHAPLKAKAFRRIKAGKQPNLRGGIRHVASDRHFLEIDHFAYKTQVRKLLAKFD